MRSHDTHSTAVSIKHCDVCGATESRTKLVSEIFIVSGKRILVEHIPARVCAQCGEATFSGNTTEKVRRLVHGEARPVGEITLEVYEFA
ncbi:MAG: YgiT-type zinc finger protein [Candidatus Competibacteraceae bacterium]